MSVHIINIKKKVEEEINKHLKKIEKWLSAWRLTMATKKCQYLVFSGKNNLAKNKMDLKLFNENLPKVENANFLGIKFDSGLTRVNDHFLELEPKSACAKSRDPSHF